MKISPLWQLLPATLKVSTIMKRQNLSLFFILLHQVLYNCLMRTILSAYLYKSGNSLENMSELDSTLSAFCYTMQWLWSIGVESKISLRLHCSVAIDLQWWQHPCVIYPWPPTVMQFYVYIYVHIWNHTKPGYYHHLISPPMQSIGVQERAIQLYSLHSLTSW